MESEQTVLAQRRKDAKGPLEKSQARNSKQIQMIKNQKIPNQLDLDLNWSDFRFIWLPVCFGFRYSDFGFSFAGVLWFDGLTTLSKVEGARSIFLKSFCLTIQW
jgi:hypothetical protein